MVNILECNYCYFLLQIRSWESTVFHDSHSVSSINYSSLRSPIYPGAWALKWTVVVSCSIRTRESSLYRGHKAGDDQLQPPNLPWNLTKSDVMWNLSLATVGRLSARITLCICSERKNENILQKVIFVCLTRGLVYFRLASNSLCSWGWCWLSDFLTSSSQVLR